MRYPSLFIKTLCWPWTNRTAAESATTAVVFGGGGGTKDAFGVNGAYSSAVIICRSYDRGSLDHSDGVFHILFGQSSN